MKKHHVIEIDGQTGLFNVYTCLAAVLDSTDLDFTKMEHVGTVNSIGEYTEKMDTGELPGADCTFYADEDGLSWLPECAVVGL